MNSKQALQQQSNRKGPSARYRSRVPQRRRRTWRSRHSFLTRSLWRLVTVVSLLTTGIVVSLTPVIAAAASGTCTPNGTDPVSGAPFTSCKWWSYGGTTATFTTPIATNYSFKVWGAGGAGGVLYAVYGGHGGYCKGTLGLSANSSGGHSSVRGSECDCGSGDTVGGGVKVEANICPKSGGGMARVQLEGC